MTIEPTVYIVDDDPVLCDAIRWLLQSVNLKCEIFHNGQDFLNTQNNNSHGCLLLDIRMPIISGFDILNELNKQHNRLPVIFITGHGDVAMAVRAMQEGAIDFILKPFNDQMLLEKVQKAIIIDKERKNKFKNINIDQLISQLTAREKEIFDMVAEGKLSKQIAADLKISESTVDFHRGNLMRKMKVKTVAELVKLYVLNSIQ